LVGAPGEDKRIVVTDFVVENESHSELFMRLLSGTDEQYRRLMPTRGDGLDREFPSGREWELGWNRPLILELSDDLQCGYSLAYLVENR
jgi:hypothetical protein